jgi:hypothetical protein
MRYVAHLTVNERRVSPINAARLFLLHKFDTCEIAWALGIKEAQAARLLRAGLSDPASDRFRADKRFGGAA